MGKFEITRCTCTILTEDGLLYPSLTCISTCFDLNLHSAVKLDNVACTQSLIESGSSINMLDSYGETPLMIAVRWDSMPNVEVLLDAGANVNITNARGESALFIALHREVDFKIVEALLLRVKAEALTTDAMVQKLLEADCSFPYATLLSNADVLKDLMRRGFDVNSRNFEKRTALHFATLINNIDLVGLLINSGVDVNALDVCLNGPLYYATSHLNLAMMQLLLDHGAIAYPTNVDSCSLPLNEALMSHGNSEQVQDCLALLLQQQAFSETDDARELVFETLEIAAEWLKVSRDYWLVAHLAMLDMIDGKKRNAERLSMIDQEFTRYYFECQNILQISAVGRISLLDLLISSDHEMKLRVRSSKTFVSQVEQFCHSNQHFTKFYSYYINTLMKRISKIVRIIEFEDKGISAICYIFNGGYNELYIFARRLFDYLGMRDLEQLCKV